MEKLFFEHYEQSELNLILRDLGSRENLDVKKLFDNYKENEKIKKIKKINKKSSKQKIIKNNIARLEKNEINRDLERLTYFDNLKDVNLLILNELKYFTTKHGKDRMKMKILDIAFKSKNKGLIINLYLQLLSDKYDSKKEIKLMKKVSKYMNSIDYKSMQFRLLSNELPPLDFYNEYPIVLDDWQINTLKCIDKGTSVLVCAPTSCGKTWLSIYPGISGKRVLFVVPSVALVYQVGSLFKKFGANICLITEDFIYDDPNYKVIIGTPKYIENRLPVIGNKFDIVVYDEIHNLSSPEFGNYYERLIKILKNNQFLALSATIGNPDKLVNWFNLVCGRRIKKIIYTTRFLNLQRHLFMNSKLEKIHPLSCLELEDINNNYLINNLPMTPYDCIVLYDTLHKYFGEKVVHLNIKNVFPEENNRLTLNDARKYELLLKEELIKLVKSDTDVISNILNDYKIDYELEGDVNLYNLFKYIKLNKLTPCIVFQQNTIYCKEIFEKLVNYLEKLEKLNYPYHYSNLEFIQKIYNDSNQKLNEFRKNIKVPKDYPGKPREYIEDCCEKKWMEFNKDFQIKWKKNKIKLIQEIKNSNLSDKIKKIQILNFEKQFLEFTKENSLKYVDVFQKHPDFCLNSSSPMTANKIREIKRFIKKKTQLTVSYTNVFMQGLKRGIGIYTVDMPPVYNMIVQQLAQNGELGFVIADLSLALGINMPFRSTCILGYKDSINFKIDNYLQMIGRSGRRGMDREGHIIYANVDWISLMKGKLSEIKSNYKHLKNYNVVAKINKDFKNLSNEVFKNRIDGLENTASIRDNFYDNDTKNILIWKLRNYNECADYFIDNLMNIDMYFRIKITSESRLKLCKFLTLLFLENNIASSDKILNNDNDNIADVSEIYLYIKNILILQKFNDNNYSKFRKFKDLVNLIKDIYNVTSTDCDNFYTFISNHLKDLFTQFKNIITNSNVLN